MWKIANMHSPILQEHAHTIHTRFLSSDHRNIVQLDDAESAHYSYCTFTQQSHARACEALFCSYIEPARAWHEAASSHI